MNNRYSILIIVCLSFLVYFNSLKNDFVYDDTDLILNNRWIRSVKHIPKIFNPAGRKTIKRPYRPIRELSYLVDYKIWKYNPLGYHITNITIHMFNALLLFLLLSTIFKKRRLALLASVIFVVHPVNTEAVSWISGRKELLAVFFILISFNAFIKFIDTTLKNRMKFYIISITAFLLAVLSKETGIVLVIILVLYNFYFLKEKKVPNLKKALVPFFISTAIIIWFFLMTDAGGIVDKGYSERNVLPVLMNMSKVFFGYVKLIILPLNLKVEHIIDISSPISIGSIIYTSFLILIVIITVLLRRKKRMAGFAAAWFLAGLIPVSGIIPITNHMAERFLYLPMIGASILIAGLFDYLLEKKYKFGLVLFISMILLYSVKTHMRNYDWKDNYTLWSKAVIQSPESARVRFNLGVELMEKGQKNEAEQHFQEFEKIDPGDSDLYVNIGMFRAWEGNYKKAKENFIKAVALNPLNADAHNNLGNIYLREGKHKLAEIQYLKTIKLDGYIPETYYNLGNLYYNNIRSMLDMEKLNKYVDSSLEELKNSDYIRSLIHLRIKAEKNYRKAIELNPHYIKAYNNLIQLYKEEAVLLKEARATSADAKINKINELKLKMKELRLE